MHLVGLAGLQIPNHDKALLIPRGDQVLLLRYRRDDDSSAKGLAIQLFHHEVGVGVFLGSLTGKLHPPRRILGEVLRVCHLFELISGLEGVGVPVRLVVRPVLLLIVDFDLVVPLRGDDDGGPLYLGRLLVSRDAPVGYEVL